MADDAARLNESDLVSRLNDLVRRLEKVQADRITDRERITRLMEERDVLQSSLSSVQSDLDGLQRVHKALTLEQNGGETAPDEQAGDDPSSTQSPATDHDSETLRAELESLRSAYSLLKNQYIDLQQDLERNNMGAPADQDGDQDSQLTQLKAQRYSLERKLEATQIQCEAQTRELGSLQAQLNQMEVLKTDLVRRLDEAIARLEAIRAA